MQNTGHPPKWHACASTTHIYSTLFWGMYSYGNIKHGCLIPISVAEIISV